MKVVNERAAYAHYKEHRNHIASFCGTSNNTHFLVDPTGNRRWLPFEVENIDSPYDFPVDYAGIYSQAYALLKNDFHYWLEDKEIEALSLHNRHFEVPCLERELILTHYRRPMPGEKCMFITNSQILCRINSGIRQKLSPVKIGMVLKQEGFEPIRTGGKRGYRMVELTGDEIQANSYARGDIRSISKVPLCISKVLFYESKVPLYSAFNSQLPFRFSQRINNEPYLCRCICPHLIRRNQRMKLAPQCGMKIYPLIQFAESGLRAKTRAINLGQFRPPVCTYLKNIHIS